MASVKVKLRPSSISGKAGTIYYQIIHRRKTLHINTPMKIRAEYWNPDLGRPLRNFPDRQTIEHRINGDIANLHHIIHELDSRGISYSALDIVQQFKNSKQTILLADFFRRQISLLAKNNRLGTVQNYTKTWKSFSRFLNGEDIPLAAISEQLISDYNSFLVQSGLSRNSVSFYMRTLRAIYNKAVRQKLIVQTFPFADVYTGVDRTPKRAVSESVIAQLYKLDLQNNSPLELARDLFIFSYCTRGMAFVDIAFLKKSNLRDGIICYARHKTGQQLMIRIEPCIQQIIDRHASSDSPYLFPLLSSLDPETAYHQYQTAINTQNRMLRRLARLLPEACRLTSYTSRHSWASAARKHNVPLAVISAGMGHSSERTTQIYLTMLENSIIDEANLGIIETMLV